LRPSTPSDRGARVLIVFADGYGTLLPAIDGYIGALTYDAQEHELTSVECEPSDNTDLHRQVEPSILRQPRGPGSFAARSSHADRP